jgi:hypothetical protein
MGVLRWSVLAMRLLITVGLERPSAMQAPDMHPLNAHESVFALLAAEDPTALDGMRAPPPYHSVGHVRELEPCDVETDECWARLVEGACRPVYIHNVLPHLTIHPQLTSTTSVTPATRVLVPERRQ